MDDMNPYEDIDDEKEMMEEDVDIEEEESY